ncbi:MAG: tRNA epoxyqueuosine(34) reductase QueG [Calditrichia bacterium]
MINTKAIKEQILKAAQEENFDDIGFAVPGQTESELHRLLTKWVENGHHGNMSWYVKILDQRINIRNYFPGIRSVVVFLMNYRHDCRQHDAGFKIASYAHGKDYHKVLRKKINRIAKKIKEVVPELQYKISVDSSPVAERYWAVKAGLGWIGKNGMFISRKFGSFTFLATLLVNIDLEENNSTVPDYCGKCNKCFESCPTNAILPGKIVDSNRCISYLTIEHQTQIDSELASKLFPWIFGCDVCQDVCPWNRKKIFTKEHRFRDIYTDLVSSDYSEVTADSFDSIFEGTAVRRAGFTHFSYIRSLLLNMKKNQEL